MKIWLLRAGTVLALGFLALTFVNASWLAAAPRGSVRQIAHRAVAPYFDPADVAPGGCAAAKIEAPIHPYIEDTVASAIQARRMAAILTEIDVSPTADGRIVAFPDPELDCRTEGKGPVRAKTLAELQKLDVGYGYTADGGRSFPLRGTGVGAMPTLDQVTRALPTNAILFNFVSDQPGDAKLLIAALKAAGRDVAGLGDGFHGTPAQVALIRAQYPEAWVWSDQSAEDCHSGYVLYGWTGITPAACAGGTLIVPIDRQWEIWGWPNRTSARMAKAGARIVVAGPQGSTITGLSLPEQIGEIPSSFTGYLWVDDLWNVGPALHSSIDRRNGHQIDQAEKALAARRAKQ
ncbi:MAG: glycerophosphodiester phosphodiesterase family protein [Candidatus Andeanibacterium colombiense]|uniref:Glycerophosphodiester phosphodiesterase family protein n=1 Tax=Candidatus Andeanibacterium colombiense TaxID=3121345 RepID=A0AAJ5X499_9SPHN|nr:MAG: glycerophosphodiester phosphodiesterase family protein [Sphingomonadaceae bacterium]